MRRVQWLSLIDLLIEEIHLGDLSCTWPIPILAHVNRFIALMSPSRVAELPLSIVHHEVLSDFDCTCGYCHRR